jgi:hypothetical protein
MYVSKKSDEGGVDDIGLGFRAVVGFGLSWSYTIKNWLRIWKLNSHHQGLVKICTGLSDGPPGQVI